MKLLAKNNLAPQIPVGPLLFDLAALRVCLPLGDDRKLWVSLRPMAWRILSVIALFNRVVTRNEIAILVYGRKDLRSGTIDDWIGEIRSSLGEHAYLLKTKHRHGYYLDVSGKD
jgi:hypothetical protein